MSAITTTATTLTEPNIVVGLSLDTESKVDEEDSDIELYRAVMRLEIERDAFDITSIGQPTDELISRASINCRFNDTDAIELLPLKGSLTGTTYEFKLISQTFTPKNERGSKFFTLRQTYTSVTPWETLSWG